MAFIFFVSSLILSATAFPQDLSLQDLGGLGIKVYDGKNKKDLLNSDCKITISGTNKNPVIFFSVSQGNSSFGFWTINPSFRASAGIDPASVFITDSMNLVESTGRVKVYLNNAKLGGGSSFVALIAWPDSKSLKHVDFRYINEIGELKAEIFCDQLRLR